MKAKEYEDAIKMCIEHKDHASVIALGPPGIGKTAIPISVCKKLEIPYSILRLNLVNPSDIRGMAYIAEVEDSEGNKERTAVWAWPGMLPKNDGRVHIVILDDVTNSPTTVQSTAYGMVLEHCAGEHDLSHIRFISTGNRVEDASGAYALSAALLNRFERINLEVDLEEMRTYAMLSGWDPMIPAFWRFKPDSVHNFKPSDARKGEPFPTPRSWDMLNTAMKIYKNIGLEKIGNYIGEGSALEFHAFISLRDKLPDPRKIILGKSKEVPKGDVSIIYATIGAIVSYFMHQLSNLKISKVDAATNLLAYSEKLSAEYSVLLINDIVKFDLESLSKAKGWTEWATKKAGFILNEPDQC